MIRKKKKRPKPQPFRMLHQSFHLFAVVYDLYQKGVYHDKRTNDPVVGSGEPVDTIK